MNSVKLQFVFLDENQHRNENVKPSKFYMKTHDPKPMGNPKSVSKPKCMGEPKPETNSCSHDYEHKRYHNLEYKTKCTET